MATNSQSSHERNRWKYLSFALIGILAAGGTLASVPQASAHMTTNVQHMLEHIYSFVDGIEAKTNNLPADPASNTVVNTRASQTSLDNLKSTLEQTETDIVGAVSTRADGTNYTPARAENLDNLDETISSRASQSSVDANKVLLDSIDLNVNNMGGTLGTIEDAVSSVESGKVVRVVHQFDDGADGLYTGTITFSRVAGEGGYLVERMFVCGMSGRDNLADDSIGAFYSYGPYSLPYGDRTGYGDGSCDDMLRDDRGPSIVGDNHYAEIRLAGDEANPLRMSLLEIDVNTVANDLDGAYIVAWLTGVSSEEDIEIASTTADT